MRPPEPHPTSNSSIESNAMTQAIRFHETGGPEVLRLENV